MSDELSAGTLPAPRSTIESDSLPVASCTATNGHGQDQPCADRQTRRPGSTGRVPAHNPRRGDAVTPYTVTVPGCSVLKNPEESINQNINTALDSPYTPESGPGSRSPGTRQPVPILNYIAALWASQVAGLPRLGVLPFDPLSYEVQLLTLPGEAVEGLKGIVTDGVHRWWNVRIPKNANGIKAEPAFKNYVIRWPLHEYADKIGSTGWDWRAKRSRWVGFDFDAIAGHKANTLTEDQLHEVKEAARKLPYIKARTSTSGNGLHLFALTDIPAENHTVHANYAKAILKKMSRDSGFDFASRKDVCGGNMWLWSRSMTERSFQWLS